jgi:thioester reductase-like protein
MSRIGSEHTGRRSSCRVEGLKSTASDGVLLTGATGFLGMALLGRYLERTNRHVYVLVRGRDHRVASARIQRALQCLFGATHPYANRVVALRGDLTRPDLGLRHSRDVIAESVTEIVHGAASVFVRAWARSFAPDQRGGHPASARARRAL